MTALHASFVAVPAVVIGISVALVALVATTLFIVKPQGIETAIGGLDKIGKLSL